MTKRMQEPSFLVLTALADQPRHGYAVLTEIQRITGREDVIRVGTLYAALERLDREGLVEIVSNETVDGRHRRTYRLTLHGRAVLELEAQRLHDLAVQARRRLGPARRMLTPEWGL